MGQPNTADRQYAFPMRNEPYYVYTDGSFSNKTNVGVLGFMIFDNSHDHESETISRAIVHTQTVEDENNIRIELLSALSALERVKNEVIEPIRQYEVHLYTDCSAILNLQKRREKLETTGFISKRKGKPLKNADLYRQFFKLYDEIRPTIHWIKGHSPKREKNSIERNFSFLDKLVRKELRKLGG